MKKLISILLAVMLVCTCVIPEAFAASSDVGIFGFKATSADKKIKLSWESSGAGEYTVNWKRSSSSEWKVAGTVKKTSVNVSGLKNGVSYDFRVTAGGVSTAVITISPSADKSVTVRAAEPEKTGVETAKEAVSKMGAGYNIGNTFDSMGTWLPANATVKQHETAWGNPQITKELIECIADQGFCAVRLPVTWNFNSDSKGNIRKEWLDRVQQVVDWILDEGMYCIINVHHDTGSDGWIHVSESSYDKAKDRFANIWKQVATRFKDYDEKLIFECFNETLNDSNDWNSTSQSDYDIIRRYEQLFIDTVRKTGGKNGERNIVVSTYAASSNPTIINSFKLPEDTVEGHMILEVHNYDPQGFTWKDASWTTTRDTWGTAQDKKDLDNFMKLLSQKAEKLGVPAIIGEFGSQDKNNDSERAEHAAYFVSAAKKQGIVCFFWDDGGDYRLIDRSKAKVLKQKIIDALVDSAK